MVVVRVMCTSKSLVFVSVLRWHHKMWVCTPFLIKCGGLFRVANRKLRNLRIVPLLEGFGDELFIGHRLFVNLYLILFVEIFTADYPLERRALLQLLNYKVNTFLLFFGHRSGQIRNRDFYFPYDWCPVIFGNRIQTFDHDFSVLPKLALMLCEFN